MRKSIVAALTGLVVAALHGCSSPTEHAFPEVGTHPSVIEWMGTTEIDVPAEAQSGDEILVDITTFGGAGYAFEAGETIVRLGEGTVTVEPRDVWKSEGRILSYLHRFEHTVALTFETAGRTRIDVVGRDEQSRPVLKTYWIEVSAGPAR